MRMASGVGAVQYRIKIQGVLDSRWSDYFGDLTLVDDEGVTTISGPIVDQTALHGVLMQIRDLGLPLLLVQQIDIEEHSYGRISDEKEGYR